LAQLKHILSIAVGFFKMENSNSIDRNEIFDLAYRFVTETS